MDKRQIRLEMKEKLNELTKPEYEDFSFRIANQLYEDVDWQVASVVGITLSRPPEVDTYQIIRKAWEQNKTIVVPKCDPKDRQMTFRILNNFQQLESVYFGLYEPIEEKTTALLSEAIDLLIVPGVAYSKTGFRIGFGGGYYDRFLTNYDGKTISLAFSLQLVDRLPIERHDIPVSKVITEDEVIVIGK